MPAPSGRPGNSAGNSAPVSAASKEQTTLFSTGSKASPFSSFDTKNAAASGGLPQNGPRTWQARGKTDPVEVLRFLAHLSDPNHSVLLRALLDREHAARREELARRMEEARIRERFGLPDSLRATESTDALQLALPLPELSAGPSAYRLAEERLSWLRDESAVKFAEFRDKWRKRLAPSQLLPFLHRNQWIVKTDGGVTVAGKGSRKEAKMLYLQSLHDMASDAERQVSAISGHVFRLQGELAASWHKESITDDRSRLLPALESALREGETAIFKSVRLSLGDIAAETFMDRVNRWDKRIYASEEELFRGAAWPWYHPRYRSGFEGFLEAFADLAEAVTASMLTHYEIKWNLFLRGLSPGMPQRRPQPLSSGENIHA